MEKSTQNLVGRSGIDVVRSQEKETLRGAAFLAHQVLNGRNGLLIRGCPGVEDIFLHLLALVLDRVKQKSVQFFKNGKHRFPRNGCPATKDDCNLVLAQ